MLHNDFDDLSDYLRYLDEVETELAFHHYRKFGFPYYKLRDYEKIQIFKKLVTQNLQMAKPQRTLFGQTTECEQANHGINLATSYHPHIFDTYAINTNSATAAFKDDKKMRYSIELAKTTQGGHKINDTNVRSMLRLVRGTQICNNFRPLVAKAIYRRFNKGTKVYDPSSGYGARLLAFMVAYPIGDHTYTCVDPDARTCEGNRKMAEFFGFSDRVTIINKPMEEVNVEEHIDTVDCIFTSPPYFKKEIYAEDDTQSCNRYPEYENWMNLFWKVTCKKIYDMLKADRYFCVNLKDVKISSKKYPLTKDTVDYCKELGFGYCGEIQMIFPHGFGKGLNVPRYEPILVFYKGEVTDEIKL